jgi:hypothetical protein
MGTYTSFIADQTAGRKGCKSDTCRNNIDRAIKYALDLYKAELLKVFEQALSIEAINGAAMRISGDMSRTAGIYGAANRINADRSAAIQGKVGRILTSQGKAADVIMKANAKVRDAERYGKILNGLANYGPLAVGGLLLGGALWKRTR